MAYRIRNRIWLSIETQANMLRLKFRTQPGLFNQEELASRLKVEVFDKEDSLSEKLSLPSSVMVQKKTAHDRVVLRVKEDFALHTDEFKQLIEDAYKGSSVQPEINGEMELEQ